MTREALAVRLERARLHRIHPGVYAVGHAAISDRGRWMAAVLVGWPNALLSHSSAAALWGIRTHRGTRAEILVAGSAIRGSQGVTVHRVRRMHPDDGTELGGIPVTSVAMTLLHSAGSVSRTRLEQTAAEAARRNLIDLTAVRELCDRSLGRRGLVPLRRVIARDLTLTARTLSELERRFVGLCERGGLPPFEPNATVEGLMVDALWRDHRLIVELDGRAFHRLASDQRRDNARTRKLAEAGYRVIRFDWWDITEGAGEVISALRRLLGAPH